MGGGGEGHRYGIRLNLCKILYEWVSSIYPVTAATIALTWHVSDEILKKKVDL